MIYQNMCLGLFCPPSYGSYPGPESSQALECSGASKLPKPGIEPAVKYFVTLDKANPLDYSVTMFKRLARGPTSETTAATGGPKSQRHV